MELADSTGKAGEASYWPGNLIFAGVVNGILLLTLAVIALLFLSLGVYFIKGLHLFVTLLNLNSYTHIL